MIHLHNDAQTAGDDGVDEDRRRRARAGGSGDEETSTSPSAVGENNDVAINEEMKDGEEARIRGE